MQRKTTFQTLAFFTDLHNRGLIDLDPPYQRRSIWSQRYKDFFIDTVLNNFPCPAIFLYEEISPSGTAKYHVVDGKQRLSTCFEFVTNAFPVYDEATVASLRGKYFTDFLDEQKLAVWRYQFSVEYVPQEDERLITEIFDRINRNVARLTRQELRHAKYSGVFIQEVEASAEKIGELLPQNFPAMAVQSRRQMKDLEMVGNLLLLTEVGARSYSQDQLDGAYSERDDEWPQRDQVAQEFTDVLIAIRDILNADTDNLLVRSRLRNQTDFYSLFGGINEVKRKRISVSPDIVGARLKSFIAILEDEVRREALPFASAYYSASRSASNDQGPRQTRINMLYGVVSGDLIVA